MTNTKEQFEQEFKAEWDKLNECNQDPIYCDVYYGLFPCGNYVCHKKKDKK